MSNMDEGSSLTLMWILVLTMTNWHCLTPPVSPNPQIWRQIGQYNSIRVHPYDPWDSMLMAQTLCIWQLWMYEVVRGGYQPQPWHNDINFTPQVNLTTQIWGQLSRCNGIWMHLDALETAWQWLKHLVYDKYGFGKQSEVDISLNPMNKMILFDSTTSEPGSSNLETNWLVRRYKYKGAPIWPLRQHANGSNTWYMCNKDVWSGLRWTLVSTPWTKWFCSTPQQASPNPQIWRQLGRYNGISIRVHPYDPSTACQWLNHCVYGNYGYMKWSEVDISLNHDVMTSFSLHKWTWLPKSGTNLAGVTAYGCTQMPLRQHANGSNTWYMSNMDERSSLRWILVSTMTKWYCSTPQQASPNPQIWRQIGRYNGISIRVHPYAPWEDSIPMAQTICIWPLRMYKVVWGGYQPHHDVMASFLLHNLTRRHSWSLTINCYSWVLLFLVTLQLI